MSGVTRHCEYNQTIYSMSQHRCSSIMFFNESSMLWFLSAETGFSLLMPTCCKMSGKYWPQEQADMRRLLYNMGQSKLSCNTWPWFGLVCTTHLSIPTTVTDCMLLTHRRETSLRLERQKGKLTRSGKLTEELSHQTVNSKAGLGTGVHEEGCCLYTTPQRANRQDGLCLE